MKEFTFELSDDLTGWLDDRAAKTGRSREEIVLAILDRAHREESEKPWMELAGTIDGPPDLSMRKGYSRT